MRLPGAALAAAGGEGCERDAHRNALPAVVAMGPVGEDAAAAEARADQFAIDFGRDQMGRRGDLRSCGFFRQIAAGIGEVE